MGSILGIDWNGDGQLDWQDAAVDMAVIQEEMDREQDEEEEDGEE